MGCLPAPGYPLADGNTVSTPLVDDVSSVDCSLVEEIPADSSLVAADHIVTNESAAVFSPRQIDALLRWLIMRQENVELFDSEGKLTSLAPFFYINSSVNSRFKHLKNIVICIFVLYYCKLHICSVGSMANVFTLYI